MKIISRIPWFRCIPGSVVVMVGGCLILWTILYGCKTMGVVADIGATVGVASGVITQDQAESISKGAKAVAKTFEDFTPEQEYYIGRTVGAVILDKYRPYRNAKANAYINLIGQTLAKASEMPETFGGYHFLIQDSDEINALAAPGGLIFVTRGILKCCRHEDAVAAVLAHEIGHIQAKHGLQAIKKSRVTSAITTLGVEGAKTFGGEELAQLTNTFEDSISDITATLVNKGYSRSFEHEADKAAVTILTRMGYDPHALIDMLKVMKTKLKPGGLDFAKTHPSPDSRIADIQTLCNQPAATAKPKARQDRFMAALGGI
jgi:beta-barrel assembly-enhancing protease